MRSFVSPKKQLDGTPALSVLSTYSMASVQLLVSQLELCHYVLCRAVLGRSLKTVHIAGCPTQELIEGSQSVEQLKAKQARGMVLWISLQQSQDPPLE